MTAPRRTLGRSLRVVAFLMRGHVGLYAVIFAMSLAEGLLGGLAIAALFPLFSSLAMSGGPEAGVALAWVQAIVAHLPIGHPVVAAGCFLLFLALLKCVFTLAHDTLSGYAAAQVGYALRNRVLQRYVDGGYPLFVSQRQGELVYTLYTGCVRVGNFFNQLPLVIVQIVNILALLGLLISIHTVATVGLVAVVAALHLGASWLSTRVAFPIGAARKACMVEQQAIVNEFITGFKQIFVFRSVPAWREMYDAVNRQARNLATRETALLATPKSTWELVAFAGGAMVMIWVGVRSPGGLAAHIGALGVYLVALQRLLPFISTLSRQWMTLHGLLPDVVAIHAALAAPAPARRRGERVLGPLTTGIRFDTVTFGYPGRTVLLSNVSLTLDHGKVTALAGASGAGKTTILNLILGLFEPTSGCIRVDGVDLREARLDSWLGQIGFVSQDSFIFNGTIRDNIAFFRECSRDEIEEAARLANAHDFISELPEGYDTLVGDRGMRISGGQQQRIALARAMLKKPDVLLLDEATSSLDSLSETLIRDSIRKISVNRTVVIVAHRPSTIADADRIIVVRDGRPVEEGTHAELLDRRGHYHALYAGHAVAVAE